MKGSEIENVVNLLGLQTLSPLTNPASSLPLPGPFYNDGWPPVLLLHLTRFERVSGHIHKVTTPVHAPDLLRLVT